MIPEQGQLLTEIEKFTGVLIEKLEYPDFNPGPIPDDVRAERGREQERENNPSTSMSGRAQPTGLQETSKEQFRLMFPGGVIPKSMPRPSLGSKFRTRHRR